MNDVPIWSPPAPTPAQATQAPPTPPPDGSTWVRADLGFAASHTDMQDAPEIAVTRTGGGKRTLGIVAVVVAVIGALAGGYLLLSGGDTPPLSLTYGLEPGATSLLDVELGSDLDLDTERGHLKQRDRVTALASLSAFGRSGGVVLRGHLEPAEIIVNEQPSPRVNPVRYSMRLRQDGLTLCATTPLLTGPRDRHFTVGLFFLGPALPGGKVEPGDTWAAHGQTRCPGRGKPSAVESTATFARYQGEDDERRAIVESRLVFEGGKPREGSITRFDPIVVDMTTTFDGTTGRFLRAEGIVVTSFDALLSNLGRTHAVETASFVVVPHG